MEVLFLAAEAVPLSKVGGLADVAGALPKALGERGHRVRLVVPLHTASPPPGSRPLAPAVPIPLKGSREQVSFWETPLAPGLTAYPVDHPRYFRRERVYGDPDDLERFSLFSLAALALPQVLGIRPDVVHANDWHTALAVRVLVRDGTGGPPSLFTIHNLQYQGHFSADWFATTLGDGFPEAGLFGELGIYPNMLSLGLLYASRVSTVSPTYAREITSPEHSFGLHPFFARRREGVTGIVNGIDYGEYDPSRDSLLPSPFTASSLEKRLVNKRALQRRMGLPQRDVPLFGMVSRLAEQKGMDILVPALRDFLPRAEAQFVILGTAITGTKEEGYRQGLEELGRHLPQKAALSVGFDEPLARLIYGGCDVFLMPSRFEPCGLGQLIAMRYGAVPLVRRTGGLADTVEEVDRELSRGTGFVFGSYTPRALVAAMRRAAAAFVNREGWRGVQRRGMARDSSWGASAARYEEVYHQLTRGRVGPGA